MDDLPATIDQVDKTFMTKVLRGAGILAADDEVVATEERDVGMTAGYFSAIKKAPPVRPMPSSSRRGRRSRSFPSQRSRRCS